ncbi:MAG: hypothetical protein NTY44_09715 [Deltaproteobacteria bacterium]|nr:hypothetical protein [Deltaproteobacteria bacterium]
MDSRRSSAWRAPVKRSTSNRFRMFWGLALLSKEDKQGRLETSDRLASQGMGFVLCTSFHLGAKGALLRR